MSGLLEIFLWPVIGGALIGLSSALLLLLHGRIAGISGILGGALTFGEGEALWRWSFVAGLAGGGLLMWLWSGPALFVNDTGASTVAVAAAGLLVGFGTRLGSGCTSGHGICGISRGSPRSLIAVPTFIIAGAVVVALRGLV